jgi:hypothetical protein
MQSSGYSRDYSHALRLTRGSTRGFLSSINIQNLPDEVLFIILEFVDVLDTVVLHQVKCSQTSIRDWTQQVIRCQNCSTGFCMMTCIVEYRTRQGVYPVPLVLLKATRHPNFAKSSYGAPRYSTTGHRLCCRHIQLLESHFLEPQ